MRRGAFRLLCLLPTFSLFATLSCSPPGEDAHLSVVLVTIDTLRADRLGCYGGEAQTPNLDRLALEGSLFLEAVAQSPLTLPSHSSILTGTYPTHHGVRDNARFQLPESIDTAAELLKKEGFSTAAFVGAFPVHSRFGLSQGFDTYDEDFSRSAFAQSAPERPAEEVIARATDWVKKQKGSPFFLWVHLFDPHAPYEPPEPFSSRYDDNYDGEVAYVDQSIGALISSLREDVVIVVTADHGEGLGDHEEATHSLFIYDSTLRVPLIMRGPGIPSETVIRKQVRTIDILPTILDLTATTDVCAACQGESLLGLMRGGEDIDSRTSYAETYYPRLNLGWSELRSLRKNGWKYIAAPEPELYDLSADPGELNNLAKREPKKLDELATELTAFETETAAPISSSLDATDGNTVKMLRSLGYIISASASQPAGPLPDPKSRLALWHQFREAMKHLADRNLDLAIREFEAVLEQDSGLLVARSFLSGAYFDRGRYEAAASQCAEILASDPTDSATAYLLGRSLIRLGKYREAQQALRQAAELDSNAAEPLAELANLYLLEGATAKASQAIVRASERDPIAPSVLLVQGKVQMTEGKLKEAERSLLAALAADPFQEEPRAQLAYLLLRQSRVNEAEKLLREGLSQQPQSAFLHLGLGRAQAMSGNLDQAIRSFERAFELEPGSLVVLNRLGTAYLEANQREKGIELLERSIEMNPRQPGILDLLKKHGAQ